MKNIYVLLVLVFSLFSCDKATDTAELPPCADELFELFTAENETCDGAQVAIYMFQDMEVSVFAQGNCISDSSTSVFNEDCEEICFLGGIAGFQDCDGVNFYDNASLVRILWER